MCFITTNKQPKSDDNTQLVQSENWTLNYQTVKGEDVNLTRPDITFYNKILQIFFF